MSVVKIGGFQKSSLIDYPEKISAIIFTQGCNFRCPYCHNPELIGNKDSLIPVDEILEFLNGRVGKLDGVVITGGEPTLHKDLPDFIKQIKQLNFCVKLDTNGTNPKMLQNLINDNLIDYVAMDVKAPLSKYSEVMGTSIDTEKIQKSISILKTSNIDYEFRTTVVKSQLNSDDFENIAKLISGSKKYYLQRFLPTKTLDNLFKQEKTYSDEEFAPIIDKLRTRIKQVELR